MALPTQWFGNRAQIIQVAQATVGLVGSIGSFFSKAPVWVPAALAGLFIGAVVARLAQRGSPAPATMPVALASPTPQSALTLVTHEFVADDREHIQYKRKLYLQFQNTGAQDVVIGPETTWKHADLHVSTTSEHVWQVEGPNGFRNHDWTKEAIAVIVPPGKRVRTWVGLPNGARKDDVDAYLSQHRAGALVTQVAWDNRVELVI